MATSRQIAEHILDLLEDFNRGFDDKYDIRDIYFAMDLYSSELAQEGVLESIKYGQSTSVPNSFIVSLKNVPILYDSDFDLNYSVLPFAPIDLPNNAGIDFVSPMKNRNAAYLIIGRSEASLFSTHPAGNFQGRVAVWMEGGQKMFYSKKFDGSENNDVFVRLVCGSASAIDKDLDYPLSSSEQAELVRRVVQHFRQLEGGVDATKDSLDQK